MERGRLAHQRPRSPRSNRRRVSIYPRLNPYSYNTGMASPEFKRCLGCGYILDHLPEPRCPECGRGFDPDDPATYGPRPKDGWVLFWRVQLTVYLMVIVVVVVFYASLLFARPSRGEFVEPLQQLAIAVCVAGLGFVLSQVLRWRLRELAGGLMLFEAVVVVVIVHFYGGWDARWFLWTSKFTGAPFLVPIIVELIVRTAAKPNRRDR